MALDFDPLPFASNALVRPFVVAFLLLALARADARAQDARVNAATRTASFEQTQEAAAVSRTVATSGETTDQVDLDLGQQQAVGEGQRSLGIYFSGNSSLYYTSNPSLSETPGRGDMYFVATGAAGIYPNIAGGLYLDAHFTQSVFQYARFSSLDFTVMNAGGGLDYVFQSLGQLTASVRYEYQRYLNGDTLNEFFVNNAITIGLSKQFLLSETQSLQLGWQSAFSVTAYPSSARFNEHDFWIGWRWRLIDPLEFQAYYILSLYYYPSSERTDATNNFGAALNLYITRWLRLTASAGFGVNGSTDPQFNYTTANAGGSLGLDFRF